MFETESLNSSNAKHRGMKRILMAAVVIGGIYLAMTKGSKIFSGEAGGCGCGCIGNGNCGNKEEKEAEDANQGYMEEWNSDSAYPNTFDPVNDFLPRYRFPPTSSWSKAYNPADSYRPLDYQTISYDEETRCKAGVE